MVSFGTFITIICVRLRAADECVQLHGGAGFIWDYAVTRNYADARVQPIYGGTNEIMMELVARSIDK